MNHSVSPIRSFMTLICPRNDLEHAPPIVALTRVYLEISLVSSDFTASERHTLSSPLHALTRKYSSIDESLWSISSLQLGGGFHHSSLSSLQLRGGFHHSSLADSTWRSSSLLD